MVQRACRYEKQTGSAPQSSNLKPMTADDLRAVFCDELIAQELDETNAYIPIPEEIVDFYKMYRPSPLVRAYCLEKKLQTPAKIYYKLKAITQVEATSLTLLSHRLIMQKAGA